jgi:hypothetical protein
MMSVSHPHPPTLIHTGIVAGVHRIVETARVKEARDKATKAPAAAAPSESAASDAAPAAETAGMSLSQLTPLLDRWSFSGLVSITDQILSRK